MKTLSQVTKVVKEPTYAMQRGLQYVRRYLERRRFVPLVGEAMVSKGSAAHQLIQSQARVAYGLQRADSKRVLSAEKFLAGTVQAMIHFYDTGIRRDFGICPLGFHGLSCSCSSRSQIESSIYLYGFYPPLNLFCTYRNLLRNGSCAVDVGGNIGLHTLAMATAMGHGGHVITYEVREEIVRKLRKNLEVNSVDDNVTVRNVGVGRERGSVPFNSKDDSFNEGLAHVDPGSDRFITVVSLDEDLGDQTRQISLIKIDVEGMELEVVRGAQGILGQHRPALVLEYKECSLPDRSLNRLREYIPYPVHVYGIPRRIGKLVLPDGDGRFMGCNDILVVPEDIAVNPEDHLNFLVS